jgi:spermidine synthase
MMFVRLKSSSDAGDGRSWRLDERFAQGDTMFWYFLFFLISGFCGILYELVWLRLAMAQFGVTTPLVSAVISMFMGGLGAGSWLAGQFVREHGEKIKFPALRLYALTELLIGCSAFALPLEFTWGHRLLHGMVQGSVSSGTYYVASGVIVALAMLPWCTCMGATIPLAMFAIRSDQRFESHRSFSFLYISNVVGALFGTIVPLLWIEKHGFAGTLHIGAFLNLFIAVMAWLITLTVRKRSVSASLTVTETFVRQGSRNVLFLLFMTGLATMAMELVWIRLFTVYIGPLVYSFALILFSYLLGTFLGSCVYRDASSKKEFRESQAVWVLIALFGSLPLLFADPRLHLHPIFRVLLGVTPFAAAVGYVTPMLVDRWAVGDPDKAGKAYAVNIVGCIVDPLVAGFILLPFAGEHLSMVLLVAPWLVILAPWKRFQGRKPSLIAAYGCVAAIVGMLLFTKDYGILFSPRVVLRDSTATVTAARTGMERTLLVNGTGMTSLLPTTKMMAHLTLASLEEPPRSALVICFGMGTTYRSVTSWGIHGTAVELVRSVPKVFSFFHSDAASVLALPNSHVVIDDGRRYLERTTENYDAIIIDPPPPVGAAGSSLLYSKEFYRLAQNHLSEQGILQQWLPDIGDAEQAAVARALRESFPYVRVFPSLDDSVGWHFLASMKPIPIRSAAELARRMPTTAMADMMEWGPADEPTQQFQLLLSKEMTTAQMTALAPDIPAVQDDRPVNEYFLLRFIFPQQRTSTQTETRTSVR